EIAAALTGRYSEETLARLLTHPAGLEQHESELRDRRKRLSAELAEVNQRQGEMGEQLKRLVESRQLSHLRIELDTVGKRLHDALDRWRVLTLTVMMLNQVREHYERHHQPRALREASRYLNELTGGRYTRVWTPLGENVLRVDDHDGQVLDVAVLSRGTREQ